MSTVVDVSAVVDVTPALLRTRPLPATAADGDKEDRGRVLIRLRCLISYPIEKGRRGQLHPIPDHYHLAGT